MSASDGLLKEGEGQAKSTTWDAFIPRMDLPKPFTYSKAKMIDQGIETQPEQHDL